MTTTEEESGESITAKGIQELDAEIERLEGEGREEIAKRLRVARDMGDLKENAEYHIAKEDQAHLETSISRLRQRKINAVVVDVDNEPAATPSASARPPKSPTAMATATPGPWSVRPKRTSPKAAFRPSPRSARHSGTSPSAPRSRSSPRRATGCSRSKS